MNKSLILLLISLLFLSAGCGEENQPRQTFLESYLDLRVTAYKKLQVTSEWQEVELLKKIKSSRPQTYPRQLLIKTTVQQYWKVNPEEYRKTKDLQYWDEHPPEYIENAQGQQVKIDVELVDEAGENFRFIPENGSIGELSFNYDHSPKAKEFPTEHFFTKLRIRSSIPFEASEILWTQDQY